MYIGGPSWDDYPHYVNEKNSCKINVDNFKEFIKNWNNLKNELPAFAIIYRDDNDWIDCKGFDTQEEMKAFVQKSSVIFDEK